MKKLMITTALALGLSPAMMSVPASAGLEPFLGQIMWVGFNFAPRGFALCDGQLLPINQNQALFSILGTTYGGDGRTTFALPDMRSRTVLGAGAQPGLTPRQLGEKVGSETTTYTVPTMAAHGHSTELKATTSAASTTEPNGSVLAAGQTYSNLVAPNQSLHNTAIEVANAGAGQSVNNEQPTAVINCVIALQGVFPSRN